MEFAGSGLKSALEETSITNAAIPIYANVTARPVREATEIRRLLYEQLTRPVRWEETVTNMALDGAGTFVEVGPGKVLQGLVKRIRSDVATRGIEKLADFAH